METIIDILFHLDVHLNQWALSLGLWTYVLLFVIIFCETGLVITPFLPGDSLLFAVGALCASDNAVLNLFAVAGVLLVAAILGDGVNYSIGRKIGPKVFTQSHRLLNSVHLLQAHLFYQKHGGKTIILARFLPIIRTFAPFVAGIANMQYARFSLFNVTGAVFWVVSILLCGYFLGSVPLVKNNFEIIVIAIIIIPGLPIVWQVSKKLLQSIIDKRQAKN